MELCRHNPNVDAKRGEDLGHPMKRLRPEEVALKKCKADEVAALAKRAKETPIESTDDRPAKRTQTTPSKGQAGVA